MVVFLEALALTGVIFVVKSFFSEKHRIFDYVAVCLLLMGCLYFMQGKAEAAMFIPNAEIEIRSMQHLLSPEAKLTPAQKKYYSDKIKFHAENAVRCYEAAKAKCWYLPDINDREKAKYCFTTLITTFPAGTPQSKIIAAITSFLIQYGLDCIDEWHYIQNKLYWAEYHFEMYEFYSDVVRTEG